MLITEKYRPKYFDDIVPPEGLKSKFEKWKKENCLDTHLLFYGHAGTGKSSTAQAIIRELGISDIRVINGSDETSVDVARDVIEWSGFPALTGQKVVIFEEFERMTPQAQDSLKFALEANSKQTIFIFTTNNVKKITDPIRSRCEVYCFDNIDKKEYLTKLFNICVKEDIFPNGNIPSQEVMNTFGRIVNENYPDFRAALNMLNQHIVVVDGTKTLASTRNIDNSSLEAQLIEAVRKANEIDVTGVQSSVNAIEQEQIGNCYRLLYSNLIWFTNERDKWRKILLTIQRYNVQHQTLVADSDMNLAACLIECSLLAQGLL